MVNREILDYIEQQIKENHSFDDIKSRLLSSGWDSVDIEEGFSIVVSELSKNEIPDAPEKPSNYSVGLPLKVGIGVVLVVAVAFVLLLWRGGIFTKQNMGSSFDIFSINLQNDNQGTSIDNKNDLVDRGEVNIIKTESSVVNTMNVQSFDSGLLNFSKALETCTASSVEFIHPITGETLERHVLGFEKDKCSTLEEMPNNMEINCLLDTDNRKKFADYYGKVSGSEEFKSSFSNGESTHSIDGQTVPNPLEDAISSGVCFVNL